MLWKLFEASDNLHLKVKKLFVYLFIVAYSILS